MKAMFVHWIASFVSRQDDVRLHHKGHWLQQLWSAWYWRFTSSRRRIDSSSISVIAVPVVCFFQPSSSQHRKGPNEHKPRWYVHESMHLEDQLQCERDEATDVCSVSTEDTVVNSCHIILWSISWEQLDLVQYPFSFKVVSAIPDTNYVGMKFNLDNSSFWDTEVLERCFVDVSSCDISDRSVDPVIVVGNEFLRSVLSVLQQFLWCGSGTFLFWANWSSSPSYWSVVSLNKARDTVLFFQSSPGSFFPGFVKNVLCFNNCF